MKLTPSQRWWSQKWKEGGRRGRGGIADWCHCQRRTRRRRKANKGAQAAVTKTTAKVEEDEAKMITMIDVRCMNNSADNPDTNKDGYDGDGEGDKGGVAMLANGTKVSRRNFDMSVLWAPLQHFIVDLLNSNMTLSQYIINLCTIMPLHRTQSCVRWSKQ